MQPMPCSHLQLKANLLVHPFLQDAALLYIAEWALTAPIPTGWTVHLDAESNEFFYQPSTGVSQYEHPMDQHYREYYQEMKRQEKGEES